VTYGESIVNPNYLAQNASDGFDKGFDKAPGIA